MRPTDEFDEVSRWIRWGLNDCQIHRLTGIPRPTIREWRHRGTPPGSSGWGRADCPRCGSGRLDEASYAYLLGLYLGDGCISTTLTGVHRLRIALDLRYPDIIAECRQAMARIGQRAVGLVRRSDAPRCTRVGSIGRACSPSMVPGGSTCGESASNHGSEPLWPSTRIGSFEALSIPTAGVEIIT